MLLSRLGLLVVDRSEMLVEPGIDLVNGADVGMVQRRGRLGLQDEPLAGVVVSGQLRAAGTSGRHGGSAWCRGPCRRPPYHHRRASRGPCSGRGSDLPSHAAFPTVSRLPRRLVRLRDYSLGAALPVHDRTVIRVISRCVFPGLADLGHERVLVDGDPEPGAGGDGPISVNHRR